MQFQQEVLTVLQQEDLKKVDAVLDDAAGQRGVLIAVLQKPCR
jgi:hypothetical protein